MRRAITFTLVVLALGLCVSAQQQPCQRAVAVAIATPEGTHPTTYTPHITKFLQKNAKRYPDICLSVTPVSGAQNFAIVISGSSSVTNGVTPVVKTVTSTSTSNTTGSFNGSATGNGEYWNFDGNFDGTTTSTTQSQTVVNEAYTQTDSAIFFVAYDANGVIIAQAGHVYSSRSGGDGANTLGYNLGSALGSAGARKRMYKRLFDAIEAHK